LTEDTDGRREYNSIAAEPNVLRRTYLAGLLFRKAEQEVTAARDRRNQALWSLVHHDKVRPSDVERRTGIQPSMTNYATTRASVNPDLRVEEPDETIRVAGAALEQWGEVLHDAEKLRDDGVRELSRGNRYSPADIGWLIQVTPSRVSQIAPTRATVQSSRVSIRLAGLDQMADEIRRRAELFDAAGLDSAAGLHTAANLLDHAAAEEPRR
jgi:hypothetical protein